MTVVNITAVSLNIVIKYHYNICIKGLRSYLFLVIEWTFMTLNTAYILLVIVKCCLNKEIAWLKASIYIIYYINKVSTPVEQS